MGKKQKHKSGISGGVGQSGGSGRKGTESGTEQLLSSGSTTPFLQSLERWFYAEKSGILWVLACVALGCLFGFGIGSGWLTGATEASGVAQWRIELGSRIRSSLWYQLFFQQQRSAYEEYYPFADEEYYARQGKMHPSHPRVYAVLREAIVRETNGYVHPDLGFLVPAPSGAARGLGMVRDSFHNCQIKCFPGTTQQKQELQLAQGLVPEGNAPVNVNQSDVRWPPIPDTPMYKQEETLIRVPLSFQMTRQVALDTILARLPGDIQRKLNPHELDDAALLVLLLAHERGVGRHSRWLPYIASLPKEPSCGYSPKLRPYILDSMNALSEELGVDTYGWQAELIKARNHAAKIAQGLAKDYGAYIKTPDGRTVAENIEWALCQVTSRATAGSEQYGALRLVPLLDLINHDAAAGGFVEMTGKERIGKSSILVLEKGTLLLLFYLRGPHLFSSPISLLLSSAAGDPIDAFEDDAGMFIARSLRHGRRKALKKGQELLVSYNVPHYSPLDWFIILGFVPPERQTKWQKIDAALPRVRQDSYGVTGGDDEAGKSVPTEQLWNEEYGPALISQYKQHQRQKRHERHSSSTSSSTATSSRSTTTA